MRKIQSHQYSHFKWFKRRKWNGWITCLILTCLCFSGINASSSQSSVQDLTSAQHIISGLHRIWSRSRTYYSTFPVPSKLVTDKEIADWSSSQAAFERKRSEAIELLDRAWTNAKLEEAGVRLGEFYFYGQLGLPRDIPRASDYLEQVADLYGNPIAQRILGFIFTTLDQLHTSISRPTTSSENDSENAVTTYNLSEGDIRRNHRNQVKGWLRLTMAASNDDLQALLTMGYKHMNGITSKKECKNSVRYYERVATKVINHYNSGPTGGRFLPPPKIRLSEEDGGVYPSRGYSGSAGGHRHNAATSDDDILQYLKYFADKGDLAAQVQLGDIFYTGTATIKQNLALAYRYFMAALKQYFDRDESGEAAAQTAEYSEKFIKRNAAMAAGLIGEMYRRGDFVTKNYNLALLWYQKGAELHDPIARTGLGIMYLKGLGVAKDEEKAFQHFVAAADSTDKDAPKDPKEAELQLGLIYFERENYHLAIKYLTNSANRGHILALYKMAEINHKGAGTSQNCATAVELYKAVIEKGLSWLDPIITKAYEALTTGDEELALLLYITAAEMGIEVAQANVAWLISSGQISTTSLSPTIDLKRTALTYWSRAANQNNIDGRLKLGDLTYYGIGTEVNFEKAAAHYYIAAEEHSSPMAFWNLAYMYENGIGVPQDYYMAKRYYEYILQLDPDSWVQVKLSLGKLYTRMSYAYLWEFFFGPPPPEVPQELAPDEDIAPEAHEHEEIQPDPIEEPKLEPEILDDPVDPPPSETPPQESIDFSVDADWGEYRRPSRHRSQTHWFLRKWLLQQGQGGAFDVDDDERNLENLIILLLCVFFGVLVYVRQMRRAGPNPAQEFTRTPRRRDTAGRGTRRQVRRTPGATPTTTQDATRTVRTASTEATAGSPPRTSSTRPRVGATSLAASSSSSTSVLRATSSVTHQQNGNTTNRVNGMSGSTSPGSGVTSPRSAAAAAAEARSLKAKAWTPSSSVQDGGQGSTSTPPTASGSSSRPRATARSIAGREKDEDKKE